MAVDNDPAWAPMTREALHKADAAVDRIAVAFTEDDDAEAAAVARDIGQVVIGVVSALCSAVADLAAAIRDRPA